MEAIMVGDYNVFGKIFIPQLTTSEFTDSTTIDGASRYFRVLFTIIMELLMSHLILAQWELNK